MTFRGIIVIVASILLPIVVNSELKLVQVLFRHGDRTPLADYKIWYPTDPHINEDYGPAGFGGLTEPVFYAHSVAAFVPFHSANFCVAESQSVPIFHRRIFEDPLFLGLHICPIVRAEKNRVEKSMMYLPPEKKSVSLYRYLSSHLGVNATRYHAFILHHTLTAQKSMGLSLPSWTNKVYPSEELERNAGFEYVLQSYSTELKRVNGGMWIREFIENMDGVASGQDKAKMLLYVGHEINIAGLLTALDSFEPHIPEFCSSVILELHQDSRSGEYYVRLFYKNNDNVQEYQVPRCSTPCPLEDFKILTRHLTPRDIKSDCGLTA